MQAMRRKGCMRFFTFLGLALTFMFAEVAWGLAALTGEVAGVITDPTGAVVSGASVTLKSSDTGEEYRAVTAASGSYSISPVRPGRYTLTVEKQGFARISQTLNIAV